VFPTNDEMFEIFVMYIIGPVHALSCFALAALMLVIARKLKLYQRALVLGGNVLVAALPIHYAMEMSSANREAQTIARAIAGAEGVALVALALALLFVRRAR
jgi:hypothetical protein